MRYVWHSSALRVARTVLRGLGFSWEFQLRRVRRWRYRHASLISSATRVGTLLPAAGLFANLVLQGSLGQARACLAVKSARVVSYLVSLRHHAKDATQADMLSSVIPLRAAKDALRDSSPIQQRGCLAPGAHVDMRPVEARQAARDAAAESSR